MNGQQLHSKQIVILTLAVVLAIASYWIPLPKQGGPQTLIPPASEPAGQSAPNQSMTFAREPAITARFPVMVRIPQSAVQAQPETQGKFGTVDSRSPHLPIRLDATDLANGDGIRPGNPTLAPVKDSDHSSRR